MTTRATGRGRSSQGEGRPQLRIHVVLLVAAAIITAPLVTLVLDSFKSVPDMARHPLSLPADWLVTNFTRAWDDADLARALFNTSIVAVATVVFVLLFSSLGAFVLARYRFRGNGFIYMLFIAGLALPMNLMAVPLYVLMRDLHLLDNLTSVVLVYVGFGMSLGIFLLVTFFRSVPNDLEEAARIDGANGLQVYWHVMLPLARPTLAVVGIINFLGAWNALFIPLILLNSQDSMTVTVGLSAFVGKRGTAWDLLLPAMVMVSIPTVFVFILASKQFVRGLNAGATR
jgi:ABC-type glycerol-3-phosphate transport system permease component